MGLDHDRGNVLHLDFWDPCPLFFIMCSPWPLVPVKSIVHNLVNTVTEFHWQTMYNITRIFSEHQKFGSGNGSRDESICI